MKKLNHRANKEALSFLRQELAHYKWYSNLLPVLAAVVRIALSVVPDGITQNRFGCSADRSQILCFYQKHNVCRGSIYCFNAGKYVSSK